MWRSFSGRPLVRWLFILGSGNAALHLILMGMPDWTGNQWLESIHFSAFLGFHGYLLAWLPFHCMKAARKPGMRATIEDCLAAPIPHSRIFWWLWLRGFCLGLLPVVVLYAPMGLSWRWLWTADLTTDQLLSDERVGAPFEFWREAPANLLAALLLALPWVRARGLKLAAWALAFAVLVAAPRAHVVAGGAGGAGLNFFSHGATEPLFLFYPSFSHFHPLVTLLYFAGAAAYGAALGVRLGLDAELRPDRAIWRYVVLGPAIELAAIVTCVGDDSLPAALLNPYFFLWNMLAFYAGPFGVFWLGLKWSLIWRWARRPISCA